MERTRWYLVEVSQKVKKKKNCGNSAVKSILQQFLKQMSRNVIISNDILKTSNLFDPLE